MRGRPRRVVDTEMREQDLARQRRRRPAAVDLAHHGGQRFPADPVAAALVADHVAPAAGARRFAAARCVRRRSIRCRR